MIINIARDTLQLSWVGRAAFGFEGVEEQVRCLAGYSRGNLDLNIFSSQAVGKRLGGRDCALIHISPKVDFEAPGPGA